MHPMTICVTALTLASTALPAWDATLMGQSVDGADPALPTAGESIFIPTTPAPLSCGEVPTTSAGQAQHFSRFPSPSKPTE